MYDMFEVGSSTNCARGNDPTEAGGCPAAGGNEAGAFAVRCVRIDDPGDDGAAWWFTVRGGGGIAWRDGDRDQDRQHHAYSGPASAYGVIAKTEAAFFKMVNDQGGVAGHKINFISYDDAYSPPKTVEQVRRLVEEDQVALCSTISARRPIRRSSVT